MIERNGRWLLGRRPAEKRHGGLWEFPGGKIDAGETPLEAATRELEEELGLDVQDVGDRLFAIEDDGSPFVIEFFETAAAGSPQALEHSELGWFSASELLSMPLAPADGRFAEWLAAKVGD